MLVIIVLMFSMYFSVISYYKVDKNVIQISINEIVGFEDDLIFIGLIAI